MLDLFIIFSMLIFLVKFFDWDTVTYVYTRAHREFRERQRIEVLKVYGTEEERARMKKVVCDVCGGKGCAKCIDGYIYHRGEVKEPNCPEYCRYKIAIRGKYYCSGYFCDPSQDGYEKVRKYLDVLKQ